MSVFNIFAESLVLKLSIRGRRHRAFRGCFARMVSAGLSGIFVPFFGRPASTHRGPALFALRLGAPVFSCIARRLPGSEVRYEVRGERVEFERTGNLDRDVNALTAELALRLENEIRRAPEQYFWFHKRWKTQPGK